MEARNHCQWRWKLNSIDKLYHKVYGIYMDFGTALHETIELCHARNPIITDIEIAVFYFKKKFEWLFWSNVLKYQEKEQVRLWTPTHDENGKPNKSALRPETFLEAGERVLRRFHECEELATAQVLWNEYKLEEPIARTDGLDIKFKGYIDMVVKTKSKRGETILYIIDFKTAGWGWPMDKKTDHELHYQILLYKHFFCKKHGLDPANVRTAFVLLLRAPRPVSRGSKELVKPIEFLPISAGPVSVGRAVESLNKDITQLKKRFDAGTLIKNHKNCIDDWNERCPYLGTEHCDAPVPPPKA
jgi:hypothetical protein